MRAKHHDGLKSRKLWSAGVASLIATSAFFYSVHKLVDGGQAALIPSIYTSLLGAIALYLATFAGTSVWEKIKSPNQTENEGDKK